MKYFPLHILSRWEFMWCGFMIRDLIKTTDDGWREGTDELCIDSCDSECSDIGGIMAICLFSLSTGNEQGNTG